MHRLQLVLVMGVLMAYTAVAAAQGERMGITAAARHVFEDATIPGKEFRLLQTTYAPGGQNPKHYHPSHVVFYVLEGSGIWEEEGKARGDSEIGRKPPCPSRHRSRPPQCERHRAGWYFSSS